MVKPPPTGADGSVIVVAPALTNECAGFGTNEAHPIAAALHSNSRRFIRASIYFPPLLYFAIDGVSTGSYGRNDSGRDQMADTETTSKTDLAVVKVLTPQIVFAPGGVDDVLAKIFAEARSAKTDISTATGRQAVASLAYKVARAKTFLDEMGKELVAEWKTKASAVDAERRTIRDRLDELKEEVRKPLTDWENAEKDRVANHEVSLAAIAAHTVFDTAEPSAAVIEQRLVALNGLPAREWQEFAKRASEAEIAARSFLTTLRDSAVKREAERAELERLRKEQVAREQAEREAKIAAEAAERARKEAEARAAQEAAAVAEAARKEQERVEGEKVAAEARAKKAEADRIAAIAKAESDAKAAAEAAERNRLAAIEAERKRVADAAAAEKAEQDKREANKKHRAKINGEARDAMMELGLSAEQATAVVTSIAKGEVPNVKISY